MRPVILFVSLFLFVALPGLAPAQLPVDDSFTYQGELRDSGVPINGSVDLVFNMYDAEAGGTEIGSAVSLMDVQVVDGVFTAQLDFGPVVFDGTERWLTIRVRNPHDPTDTAGYTALTPRQAVSATPYAQYAMNGSTWMSSGAGITNRNTSGFVGINRDSRVSPREYFGVGTPETSGYGGMYVTTEGASAWPFYGYSAGGTLGWHYLVGATGAWRLNLGGFDRLSVLAAGQVGIGLTSPSERLEVSGTIYSNSGGFKFPDGTIQTTAAFDAGPIPDGHSLDAPDGTPTDALSITNTGDVSMTGGAQVEGSFEVQGDALVQGELGIGVSNPVFRLDARSSSSTANLVHFERSAGSASGADLLELRAGASSSASSQFIEAENGTDIKFRVWGDGDVSVDGLVTIGGADFAELVHVPKGQASVEAGDVMVIDPASRRGFAKSTRANSTLVAGIYSTKPGVVGTETDWDQYEFQKSPVPEGEEARASKALDLALEVDEVPLAMVGIVPCKVSSQNGAVRAGDLLVTSDAPGHAMRADDPKAGTIVGKALEDMSGRSDVILVLVTLQ